MSASERPQRQRFLPGVAILLVLGVYGAVATLGYGRFDAQTRGADLYTRLVEAFAGGHTYLKEAPAPALLRLANPYDMAQNGGLRLVDASLYAGKYYVYFGVTPVVLWLWPYYALTDSHPAPALSTLVFCAAGFLAGCALLIRIRRAHFPGLGGGTEALAVLAWGLGNLAGFLLSHHDVYEIAAASGVCWLVAMLCCLHASLLSSRGGAGALAAASACYALAVGSRPTLIFTGAIFAGVLAFRWRRTGHSDWRLWAAAALPAAVLLGGLFAYNYARFGSPLEFGLHYQLTGPDRTRFTAFAWRYVPFNAYYYFVSRPGLSAYFPFVLWPASYQGSPPSGHEGAFGVVGLFWACPAALFALGALGLGTAARRSEVRVFAGMLLGAFAVIAPVLVGVGLCVYRCMPELLAPLLLLALVGGLALADRPKAPWLSGILALSGTLAVAGTALVNVLMAAQVEGMYQGLNPGQYAGVEAAANRGTGSLWGELGWHPLRPVISLRFPTDRTGTLAPLLVAGAPPSADFLYLFYATPREIQIGFESMGRGGPVSGLIPVDYAATHTLEIEGGPFVPPPGNPWIEKNAGAKAAVLRQSLLVRLDGKVVLDTYADFHDTHQQFTFGRSDQEHAFGERFVGPRFDLSWARARADFAADRFQRANYGAATLTVSFARLLPGRPEPLLSAGAKNRALLLSVAALAPGRIQFTLARSGHPPVLSAPLSMDPGRDARLVVSAGSLYPTPDNPLWPTAPADDDPRLGSFRVELNGQTVLAGTGDTVSAPPSTVAIGQNAAGISGVAAVFAGKIALLSRAW